MNKKQVLTLSGSSRYKVKELNLPAEVSMYKFYCLHLCYRADKVKPSSYSVSPDRDNDSLAFTEKVIREM